MRGKLLFFLFLIIQLLTFAIPVDKKSYLFLSSDTASQSMGNCGVIFLTRDSIETNPALLTQNEGSNLYLGYRYSDYENGIDIDKIKELKDVNYIAALSKKGGFYYRFNKESDGGLISNKKYKFSAHEFGIGSVEENSSIKGLSISMKLKLFLNQISDAEITQVGSLNLKDETGYGYGIDMGFLYKKGYFTAGAAADNIIGNIYWDNYDNIYVNPALTFGIGLESKVTKLGITAKRIFSDGEKFEYGQGMELILLNTPEDYPSLLRKFKVKLRAGIVSNEFLGSKNKKNSYGVELEKDGYFIDMITEGYGTDFFSGDEKIYKVSFGKVLK